MLNWWKKWALAAGLLAAALTVAACGHSGAGSESAASASQQGNAGLSTPADTAPPASQTGGFDGAKAYEHVAKIVSFGPRPPASEGIHQVQDYFREQLKSYGCTVGEDDFHASTPVGEVAMKNILAKAD